MKAFGEHNCLEQRKKHPKKMVIKILFWLFGETIESKKWKKRERERKTKQMK